MSKLDFSNYRLNPKTVVTAVSRGHRITDEDLLDVIERMRPGIYTDTELRCLRAILDPEVESRGRKPADGPTRASLAVKLSSIDRDDIPKKFVVYVAERLHSGKKYTNADSNLAYYKKWRKHDRDMIMRGLYREFSARIFRSTKTVTHKVLGEFPVPMPERPPSERALHLVQRILSDELGFDPPATGRMINIIAADPRRKRYAKT